MAEHDVETELDRDIGLVGAVSLGVGTMIAAGIFVLSGLAVSNVGTMAIVACLVTTLGATREGLLQQFVCGVIPEEVGKRAEGAVIITRRNLGVGSRLRRTLDRLG